MQGRYDIVCPPQTAWELHKALPSSKLYIIPDAGHSAMVSRSSRYVIAKLMYGRSPVTDASLPRYATNTLSYKQIFHRIKYRAPVLNTSSRSPRVSRPNKNIVDTIDKDNTMYLYLGPSIHTTRPLLMPREAVVHDITYI